MKRIRGSKLRPDHDGGRRIGVLRVGSIGDQVIAIPVFRALRRRHPHDFLSLMSNVPAGGNPKLVGPADILPPDLFDEICAYPALTSWRNVAEIIQLFRRLRLNRLYYLMPRRTSAQLWRDQVALRLLVPEVIGLNHVASEPRQPLGDHGLYEHEADRLARAIGLAEGRAERGPENLSLGLTAQERASIRLTAGRNGGDAVVVSVGTKCDVKHWGEAKWRRLIERLGTCSELGRLFLLGSADEHAESEALRAAWPRESINLCGKLSARQSAALMSECALFVGHDSGPMHLAAAVGIPLVAIFSSRAMPGVWYPLSDDTRVHYTIIDCMGCGLDRCPDRQKACITAIGVEAVYSSCRELLARFVREGTAS
jgi:ADP-heptose:LPS heptosyltransferase